MLDPKKMLDFLKNASDMQKNMAEKLKQYKSNGEAAGGMVKVVMNGHFEIESLSIDESLFKEDKSFVEEVTKAAVNDAAAKLRQQMAEYLKSMVGPFGF